MVLAGLVVLILLCGLWWLSLKLLDMRQAHPATHYRQFVREWPGQLLDKRVIDALVRGNVEALEATYCELKVRPGTFAEAVVSLAVAEAQGDVIKAQRGLESIRLMRGSGDLTAAQRQCGLLELLEARLRLVLADAGNDPRQWELARAALARRPSASGRSAG